MTLSTIVTWNLLFKGVIGGLITGLVAMGIVLMYRSSRVINFAVGNMGVPATALFAVMVGANGWPYWPSLAVALVLGTLIGVVIELVVIRRLFKAPRVIVFVATIGVAQLCEAVTLTLPEYRTGSLQTQFPLPFSGTWHPGLDIEVTASQILVLIVVPLIALGLWWVLGHTAFGDAVRAAATNPDLADDRHQSQDGVHRRLGDRGLPRDDFGVPHRDRSGRVGPRAHRTRHAAARHGGRADRRDGLVPARDDRRNHHRRGRSRAVLQLHERDRPRAVRSLPRGARARRRREPPRYGIERRELPVRAACRRDPRTIARHLVGETAPTVHRGVGPRRCRGDADAHRQVRASPDLDDHPRLRHLRDLRRRPHRMGRSAVAGSDGIRRSRCLDRRRAHPRPVGQHRVAQLPHHRRLVVGYLVRARPAPRCELCEP